MSKATDYYGKRLAKLNSPPEDCNDKHLKKIVDSYSDYLDAMCDEDGWVPTYEHISKKLSPYFEEAEKRGIK